MANAPIINYVGNLPHDQLTNQANNLPANQQKEFTPGKASSLPLDQNWPLEYAIPTGNPTIDNFENTNHMKHEMVYTVGENIVNNVIFPTPIVLGPQGPQGTVDRVVASNPLSTGTIIVWLDGSWIYTAIQNIPDNGRFEKSSGGYGYVS